MTVTEEVAGVASVKAVAKQKKSILQFEITKKKVPRKDLMHFSRQLAVFIKAGIPILDALDVITEEMPDKHLHQILLDVAANLREGGTFAAAVAVHEDALPPFYIGILRSAEMTGHLDEVLLQLSDYIERDVEARRKVVSALTYPAVIFVMSIGVVGVLTIYVMPKFEKFFSDLHAKLPLPTRMLLAVSAFFTAYWWMFVILAVAATAGLITVNRTDRGRFFRDRTLLKTPALGALVRCAVLERFCRILSSMTGAGVALPEAMLVTADATSNSVFRRGILSAREAMMRGEGLAGPLADTGLFPPAARQMLRVGESTGSLDTQLDTAARYFDRELDYKIKKFTDLFEPAVLLTMGVVVGFVAIALVSAMYGIFNQVKV